MRKSNWLLSTTILVITSAILCFTFSCQKQDVEADISAVKEFGNQYAVACNTGDLDLYISLWTDDGVQMPPDTPAAIGKEQIRARMKPLFDQFIMEISLSIEEVRVAGDWAFGRCTYTISTTPKKGGETVKRSGKDLHILERQADGSWKIAIDCFNYNAPVQTKSD